MAYPRNKADYDEWASLGNRHWNYESSFPISKSRAQRRYPMIFLEAQAIKRQLFAKVLELQFADAL